MSAAKVRKIDAENRQFNEDWKSEFYFFFDNKLNLPKCVICKDTVAVVKRGDLKRHYETKHKGDIKDNRKLIAKDDRLRDFDRRYRELKAQQNVMQNYASISDHVTEASLRICNILAKEKRPLKDAEFVKECFIVGADSLFHNFPNKDKIVQEIRKLQLSDDTCTRRCNVLATDVFEQLVDKLKNSPAFSIAIDETTDVTDVAQLIVCVRYVDMEQKSVCDEVLALLPLMDTTTAHDIFDAVVGLFQLLYLSFNSFVSVCTDGAPAMVSKENGFVALLKRHVSRDLFAFHCLIHMQALSVKFSKGTVMDKVMATVIKVTNFIKAHSLNHIQFKLLLQEVESECGEIIMFNNVRWLSRGSVLERFVNLLEPIKQFLQRKQKVYVELDDNAFLINLAALTDISIHVNCLNKQLQGNNKTVSDLLESIITFIDQLCMFERQISNNDLTHFRHTQQLAAGNSITTAVLMSLVNEIKSSFEYRFSALRQQQQIFDFLRNPFTVEVTVCHDLSDKFNIDRAKLELQLIALQNSFA